MLKVFTDEWIIWHIKITHSFLPTLRKGFEKAGLLQVNRPIQLTITPPFLVILTSLVNLNPILGKGARPKLSPSWPFLSCEKTCEGYRVEIYSFIQFSQSNHLSEKTFGKCLFQLHYS